EAKSFASSAKEMGLAGAAIGGLVLLVVSRMAYRSFHRQMASLRLSFPLLVAFPLVVVLVAGTRHTLPPDLAYQVENAIYADEARLVVRLTRGRAGEVDQQEVVRWLEPKAEKFRHVSNEYPLLKHTEGFEGEK